jgi:hypothetical protein
MCPNTATTSLGSKHVPSDSFVDIFVVSAQAIMEYLKIIVSNSLVFMLALSTCSSYVTEVTQTPAILNMRDNIVIDDKVYDGLKPTRSFKNNIDNAHPPGAQCDAFACSDHEVIPRQRLNVNLKEPNSTCFGLLSPDMFGNEFKTCCRDLDVCYRSCGVRKAECDTKLGGCMINTCYARFGPQGKEGPNYNPSMMHICQQNVVRLDTVVRSKGICEKYTEAQIEVCDCTNDNTITNFQYPEQTLLRQEL